MAEKKLYDFEIEEKKSDKLKKQREKQLKKEKKKNKKKTSKKTSENTKSSNQQGLENEIIIGVTVNTPNENSKSSNKKQNIKNKRKRQIDYKKKSEVLKKKPSVVRINNKSKKKKIEDEPKYIFEINSEISKDERKKDRREAKGSIFKSKIIRWTSIFIVLAGVIAFALISPLFNINKISVKGNSVLSNEKIIGMSQIEMGQNIFKISKAKVKERIKGNGYIENVTIKRWLPDEIEIVVQERIPKFQIEYGGGFVLINNQGYIIEIVSEKQLIPVLKGTTTEEGSYLSNNRLNDEDLNKLNVVLKIMNAAISNDIDNLISLIDMSNSNNFIVDFGAEQKIAYFGDCSNIETRMLWAKRMLETTTGKTGELHIDMNLNTRTPYFRESIQQ